MRYKKGSPHNQPSLFPEVSPPNSPASGTARRIQAFVEHLDMRQIGLEIHELALTGRPPYDPRDLLKLHLYGAVRGIYSCRKLERIAARDSQLAWLLREIQPKFRAIANFKKKNRRALQKAVRRFEAAKTDLIKEPVPTH